MRLASGRNRTSALQSYVPGPDVLLLGSQRSAWPAQDPIGERRGEERSQEGNTEGFLEEGAEWG